MITLKYKLQANKSLVLLLIVALSVLFYHSGNYIQTQPIATEKTPNIEKTTQFTDEVGVFTSISGELNTLVATTQDKIILFDITNKSDPVKEREIAFDNASEVILKNDILYVLQNEQFQSYFLIESNITLLDTITYETQCSNIQVKGNLIYLLVNYENISIIDISNPNKMERKVNFQVEGKLKGFCLNDNYLYVLNTNNTIIVVNITDILNFSVVFQHYNGYAAYSDIEIKDGYLYAVNRWGQEIRVFNCTLPTQLEYLTVCSNCFGMTLQIKDNFAFLIDSTNVQIINITLPNNPVKITEKRITQGVSEGKKNFYVTETMLYLINFFGGMKVIDYADGSKLTLVKNLGTGYFQRVIQQNDLLIATDAMGNIEVLRLNEENNLEKIGSYTDPEKDYCYKEIHYFDGAFYITTDTQEILILELRENNSLVKVGVYKDPDESINQIIIEGRTIFARVVNGIVVIAIENKYHPVRKNFQFEGANVYDIAIDEKKLYVLYDKGSLGKGIRIYDITNPLALKLLGSYQVNQLASYSKIDIKGKHLFVALEEKMIILDVSRPKQTVKIAEFIYRKKDYIVSLASTNLYLCIGMTGGITIVDITDINNPKEKAYYYDGEIVNGIALSRKRLFLAAGWDGVKVLETTFPLDTERKINHTIIAVAIIGIVSIGITIGIARAKGGK